MATQPELMGHRSKVHRKKRRPQTARRKVILAAIFRVMPETLVGQFTMTASITLANDVLANGFYRR